MHEEQQRWLEQQQLLANWLAVQGQEMQALTLALRQHAQIHAAALAQTGLFSFEDEVLSGLNDD